MMCCYVLRVRFLVSLVEEKYFSFFPPECVSVFNLVHLLYIFICGDEIGKDDFVKGSRVEH